MTRTTLRSTFRLYMPEAEDTDALLDEDLNTLLNLAATEFIKETNALPTSSNFTTTTSVQTYALSSFVTSFGKIRKEGIWFYNTSTTKWRQLTSSTIAYLNRNFPSWINASAGLPLRYWIEGDEIGLDPKPSSTYAGANTVKVYYFKRSTDMSADTHYPFSGSTTQYPHLADYEEVLFDWVKYRVKQIVGKAGEAEEAKTMFYTKCADIRRKLAYRPDLIPGYQAGNVGSLRNAVSAYDS